MSPELQALQAMLITAAQEELLPRFAKVIHSHKADGSVVTEAPLPPSPRPYPERRHNCLFHREGTCGACIQRCPVGALSEQGHDKARYREHVYGAVLREVGEVYGLTEAGCGLCQTGVPCESRIPA